MIEKSDSISSFVSQAIQQIVKKSFVKNAVSFTVFVSSDEIKNLDETLKLMGEVMKFELYDIYSLPDVVYPSKNLIVILDYPGNLTKFESYVDKMSPCMSSEYNVLIYGENMATDDVIEHIPVIRDHFQNYLIEENNEIILYEARTIPPPDCFGECLTEINQYSIVLHKWTTDKFFPSIIDDFFGFTIIVLLLEHYTVAPDRKSYTLDENKVEIMKALSSNLNFKIDYNLANETEFSKDIEHVYIDFYILLDDKISLNCAPTVSSGFVVAVPPGEPYTPYEKLLLPFDDLTWIFLLIFFGIGFTIVIIVRLSKSPSVNKWVIGSNIKNPAFNIFGTLMGIPMKVLPKTNVARFLLMNLILFCLIFRTAYQGKYFEFLTSYPTKKPIKTFEELADKNFTIYSSYNLDLVLDSLKIK